MPVRSTLSSRPPCLRLGRRRRQRRRDRVVRERQVLPSRRQHGVAHALLGDLLDLVVDRLLGVGRVGVHVVVRLHLALEEALHDVGMVGEELRAHDEVRGHELPARPQIALVDEHLTLALDHQARVAHGSGTQAPSMAPDLKASSVWAVVLRQDRHVAAARRVGVEALLLQPGPQGDVLRVAELRGGQLLALEVGGRVDVRLHDERGAAGRGARR